MLTRNKETLCWELSGEKSPEYTEPPEPVLEAIGNFITADNPTWEGTATELIEKLELDIKPNALSLKLNINAGKLYNLFFVQDEFQYQPVDGDPKATVCYVRGDSGNKSFHDMTDAEKENFLVTSY